MSNKANTIIATGNGPLVKYVLTHNRDAKQRCIPVFTADLDKARRFYTEVEATNYYTAFPNDGKVYRTELYKPEYA